MTKSRTAAFEDGAYRRVRDGDGFSYLLPDGSRLEDEAEAAPVYRP